MPFIAIKRFGKNFSLFVGKLEFFILNPLRKSNWIFGKDKDFENAACGCQAYGAGFLGCTVLSEECRYDKG